MGRQYRSPRRGPDSPAGLPGASHMPITAPYVVSASSTVIAIPNYGATDLSTYAAGDYVLDAPALGVQKTIVYCTSSSGNVVIRGSTGTSVKFNGGGATEIRSSGSTVGWAVQLLGINSTQWAVTGAWPINSTSSGATIATS